MRFVVAARQVVGALLMGACLAGTCLPACPRSLSEVQKPTDAASSALNDQEPANAAESARPADPNLVSLPPDTRQELLAKFLSLHPNPRLHVLEMDMNAYADSSESPGLRLHRMWVAETGTLVELEGMAVPGRSASAVIRQDTFTIHHAGGVARLQAAEGVTVLKDRRGGSALVVKPGETLLVLFEAVDDYHPMRLEHTGHDGQRFVYFDDVDPRFRERYADGWTAALKPGASPQQMSDFLVEFARHDPDGKAREVFQRLITEMRAQNSFEGYYTVYLLLQDAEDARKAGRLARTPEQLAKIEHMAVTTLVDKNRLVNFDFTLQNRPSDGGEEVNKGFFGPTINFLLGKDAKKVARQPIGGVLRVQLQRDRPIALAQGEYVFKFAISASAPRERDARGLTLAGRGRDELRIGREVSIRLSANKPQDQVQVDLGSMELAYLDRGMLGGFTSRRIVGDGVLEVRLLSVDLAKP